MSGNCFHERSPYEGLLLLNQSASIMIGFRKVVQTTFSHNSTRVVILQWRKSQKFISTGLGSKRNKLRNFFIIIALDDNKFKKTEREIINREYELVCKEFDSELEKIEFDANYSSLTVLLPMNIALSEIIENGIKRCNKDKRFIYDYYFATNDKIPDKKEILEYIREIIG